MNATPFVHLHCHSHYSLLDGASPIQALVDRAKELGMTGLALTDHGNLHGSLEFYSKAKEAGINPILGYEAYIAPGSRLSRDASGMKEAAYHLTLLAKNRTGFGNLMQLASRAFLEGFYFKPRIDKELLEEFNEGIVCLSGCVSGELSRALLEERDGEPRWEEALDVARWFQRVFGDRYFIEIQNNGLEIQRLALERSVELARRLGLPLVATSDAHYVRQEDAEAQDVLLCVNTGKLRSETNRMRMEGDQFFLRSPEQMYSALAGYEEALKQSQAIADSVDIELELGKRHFPSFAPPEQKSSADYLRELCLTGLQERYADNPRRFAGGELSAEVRERLDRELDVIEKLGFANYFLIVWDFVRFAREQGIPATARGSGVGSLVCYALYLSHVCPLDYDLLFERFLDVSRKEAPDIDIDFCQDRRALVIQYIKDKYGEANVSQIGTFSTLRARAAIRDVGRVLSMPLARVDAISAMVPDELNIKLKKALDESEELKQAYQSDAQVREVIDLALKIEGLARAVGTHAAAVVIADRPLVEYVPLGRVTGKEEVITQWAMGDVEAAGLLKMDCLGLKNLTILSKAVELIAETRGERVDPYKFPLDDAETFALLCRGETKGIFQLESGGIRDLLTRMKPDHFRDIIATNALYRPGPLEGGMVDDYVQVKHGRKPAQYPHPVMKEVLAETHGVMVYQEQVMRILNRLGGIELSSAYTCIKAISKKKLPIIARFREEFVAGATRQGLDRATAVELFEMIEKFAGYGFNKSHSTAYALIAYMTAYLKAHYPVEFMAALLCGDLANRNFKQKDALVEHLEDCRRMGIECLPPDVNRSQPQFAVEQGKIVTGLCAIKGCSDTAAAAIARARREKGPFRSIFELCERVDPSSVGRASLEALCKAGALDSLGGHRAQQMAAIDRAIQGAAGVHADRRCGQKGLFDEVEEPAAVGDVALPKVDEWPERERLANEKEVLGYYLSSHPLAQHERKLSAYCTHTVGELARLAGRTEVTVGGMLGTVKHAQTKNPRPGATHTHYAMFDLEDLSGSVRTIIWPEQFAQFGHLIQKEAILVLRAAVDRRPGSDEINLIVNEVVSLEELAGQQTRCAVVRLSEPQHSLGLVDELREALAAFPGKCELHVQIQLADGSKVLLRCDAVKVDPSDALIARIEELLGPGQLRLVSAPRQPSRQNGQRNGAAGRAYARS